jgi:sulfite reductase alpha subunit-like flavoprotein
MPKQAFILYGSQTGNAEGIAKDLAGACEEAGLPHRLHTLNEIKKGNVNLREEASVVVIVCSTTGNGDAPENAEAWWRSVKLRSVSKDTFEKMPYTVLGLGDTNYDKFCHMGKSIDKRLAELGAVAALPLTCVDETGGLEEPIEKWKGEVLQMLHKINAEVDEAA